MRNALLVFLALLPGLRSADAGEQLSVRDLVRQSDAVAVVTHRFGEPPSVRSWLRPGPEGVALGELSGVCVPPRDTLERWARSSPKHPGRATWDRLLAEGGGAQVVFLTTRDGALRPTCETEVMLGRGFEVHPEHAAFLAELDAALAESGPVAVAALAPPEGAPPAAAEEPVERPTPTRSSGCW
jgi:hypothetical protein